MTLEQIIIIFIVVVLAIAVVCILVMIYEIVKEILDKNQEKRKSKKIEEDDYFEVPEYFDTKEEYSKSLKELVTNKGINRPITRSRVKFFETNDSKIPFLEFLNALEDDSIKEKVIKEVYNLAEQGEYLNNTDQSTYLAHDIFGLVVNVNKDTNIVIYYYPDEAIDTVILLNSATIKSKMDNVQAFKLAKVYRDEYIKEQAEKVNKEEPSEAIKVSKIDNK